MRAIFIIIFIIYFLNNLFGQPQRVPATPFPVQYIQPNGDTVTIRIFGDERGHYYTTPDGFVIVMNSKGYFCYAKLDKEQKIIPSIYVVDREPQKTTCKKRHLKKMSKSDKLLKRIY